MSQLLSSRFDNPNCDRIAGVGALGHKGSPGGELRPVPATAIDGGNQLLRLAQTQFGEKAFGEVGRWPAPVGRTGYGPQACQHQGITAPFITEQIAPTPSPR